MKRTIGFYLGIFFLITFLSLPLIQPYLHNGYFPTHDGEWAVVRLSDMYREIRDRQIPPRFSGNLNFGYGYPLFNFAYPFPYYVGLVLYLGNIGLVDSIKILFAVSIPLSGIGMFLVSKKLWGNTLAAVLSSVLYIYFPYKIVDLFVRGSIGESIAFALFPFILYFLLKVNDKRSFPSFVIASILLAILITTHNIMALYFLILLAVFLVWVFASGNIRQVIYSVCSVVLGLSISAFFWIPALFEKKLILLSKIPIADRNLYFVDFDQLIFPKWGGYGTPTDIDGFSYQLGLSHVLIICLLIVFFLYSKFGKKKLINNSKDSFTVYFSLLLLFFLFLLFNVSALFWHLPLLSEINYPWTLLLPIGFLVSLFAGFLASKGKVYLYIVSFLALLSIVLSLPYVHPKTYVNRGDGFYFTNDATTTSSQELMPLWVKQFPSQRTKEKVEVQKGTIENVVDKSNSIDFSVSLPSDQTVRINTIYYPGWRLYIDGNRTRVDYSNEKGVMEISVPKGNHKIAGLFSDANAPLRFIADMISLSSVLSIIIWYLLSLFSKEKYEKNT